MGERRTKTRLAAISRVAGTAISRRLARSEKFSKWNYRPIGASVTMECRRAIFVPEQLDRVIACEWGRSLESEVDKLLATKCESSSLSVCELRDVWVLGGHIFHRDGRNLLRDAGLVDALSRTLESFDAVAIPNTYLGLRYFGHWLRDDCSGFECASDFGTMISVPLPDYRDAAGYSGMFGQVWQERKGFFAKRATFIADIGFSPEKAERLRVLRTRLRQKCKSQETPSLVFIRRGGTDPRRDPLNEIALIEQMSRVGVQVVDGDRPIAETIAAILDAEIIIGVEGSQLAHAVHLLRQNGGLVVLQSPYRFYNPHHEWCRMLGMSYGTVVGRAVDGGFEIDLCDVMQMVECVLEKVQAGCGVG